MSQADYITLDMLGVIGDSNFWSGINCTNLPPPTDPNYNRGERCQFPIGPWSEITVTANAGHD